MNRCRDCLKVTRLSYKRCPKCNSTNIGVYYSKSARQKDTTLGTDWRTFGSSKKPSKLRGTVLWSIFGIVLPPVLAFSFLSMNPLPDNSESSLPDAAASAGNDYEESLMSSENLDLRQEVLSALLTSMVEVRRGGITETENRTDFSRVIVWDPRVGDHYLDISQDEQPSEVSASCCQMNPYLSFERLYNDAADAKTLFRPVGEWIQMLKPDSEFSARVQISSGLVSKHQDVSSGMSSSYSYGVSEEYRRILVEQRGNFD